MEPSADSALGGVARHDRDEREHHARHRGVLWRIDGDHTVGAALSAGSGSSSRAFTSEFIDPRGNGGDGRNMRSTTTRIALDDGAAVRVRPLRQDVQDEVAAMHERCSRETLFLRYLSATSKLPPGLFARMCDPAHGPAAVAVAGDRVAGLVQVALSDGGGDLAIMVEDAWQGRGLGRALTGVALDLARERGSLY
jgi:GNAT superfamily N-acetyltransferase